MSTEESGPEGPDFADGVASSSLADGAMLLGHAGAEPVILVRRDGELFAIGATCTHYGAPLADGLVVDETIRCPWHHACFSLRTGEVLRAPALDPIACWRVEERDGRVFVREKIEPADHPPQRRAQAGAAGAPAQPGSVVIVGGGAAGNAAAETLRREGYEGRITMLSADESPPCDRPNLSKNYLAGTAPEEWIALRPPEFYERQRIELRLGARVAAIDTATRSAVLADGSRQPYDALLLATGAEPVRLALPGGDLAHVHYLRTLADSRALIARAQAGKRAVVIGASFIGLEATASLRARGVDVHVVGREHCPMAKILGEQLGEFIRELHEAHGVRFHLGTTPVAIDQHGVDLADGTRLAADLVVIGVGVRPALALAEQAGLETDRGLVVDEYLETSAPGIFAAGDIVRWPDPLSGERIRVEHWVVAGRQGQTAARNILGQRERFDAVPFFWTEQYDFGLAYVGHAEGFDEVRIDGELAARDCTLSYRRDGATLAVAVIHRDLEGLRAEVAFERSIAQRGPGPDRPRRGGNRSANRPS